MTTAADFPLVSAICLAGRHSVEEIARCVECFKAQTYPYKELIIVNNAKTQLEASELNLEAQPNIFIVDTPMLLMAGIARNYGISAANGAVLTQFDANYWHHPKRIESQIATMANNNAHACMLVKCLQASYNSGIVRYLENDKNVIPQTLVCVRPKDLDYPPVESGEELGLLHKMNQAGMKIITMDLPTLACQLVGQQRFLQDPQVLVEDDLSEILPHLMPQEANQKLEDSPSPS
ncbi:MAG: glycosyltransferase family 2 protein [Candidatus Hermodarchaeia archaeon]